MELMDYLDLEEVEDLYGICRKELIRYVRNGRVSLAVRLGDLTDRSFISFDGERHKRIDFPPCGDSRFGYLLSADSSGILSDGAIRKLGVTGFEKYPVGHIEHRVFQDLYRLEYDEIKQAEGVSRCDREVLESQWHEKNQDNVIRVFLTRDAIFSSEFMVSLLRAGKEYCEQNGEPQNYKNKHGANKKVEEFNIMKDFYFQWLEDSSIYKNQTAYTNAMMDKTGLGYSTIFRNLKIIKELVSYYNTVAKNMRI